jgi:hypothetical protein
MANVNDPNGFTPAFHLSGGTIRPSEFAIQSGATGDIFSGDVVKLSSGYVLQSGATDAPLGVFQGVQYTATDGTPVWSRKWTSGTSTLGSADAQAYVYVDPDIAYEAQSSGTPTQASVGALYTITTTTTSGIAKVIGFVDRPDNSIGQYARMYVSFPTSEFGNN